MRQQAPERDAAERPAAKLAQVPPEGCVERDAAALDERHHRERRAERLGERGEVEDRVLGHRLGRGQEPARAVRAVEEHAVALADEDDRAGQLARGDGVAGGLVDGGEVARARGGGDEQEDERERRRACDASGHHAAILALL